MNRKSLQGLGLRRDVSNTTMMALSRSRFFQSPSSVLATRYPELVYSNNWLALTRIPEGLKVSTTIEISSIIPTFIPSNQDQSPFSTDQCSILSFIDSINPAKTLNKSL